MRAPLPHRSTSASRRPRRTAAVAATAALLFGSAACTRDAADVAAGEQPRSEAATCPLDLSPKKATGAPIEVGNISSLTGPGTFPEASQAVKAVFDRLNECGGVGGRPVRLHVEDDQGDPTVSAQAARRLAEQDKVVLNVGSASLLDCAVNSAYYVKQKLRSIQGTGVDPVCFGSPNISPVNTGPFTGVTVSLYYASEILKKEKICRIRLFDVPGFVSAFDAAVDRWEAITGKKLTYKGEIGKATDDVTPLLLQAKKSGCQAVVVDGVEAQGAAVGKAVKANGLTGVTWIGLTSYYTDGVAKQLASTGDGLYANAEFEPYSDAAADSETMNDMRGLLRKNDIPLTSFAEGGYLAATIAENVLLGIKGEVTRATVGTALTELRSFRTPLIGSPYSFGSGDTHAPNQSSKFVVLKGGKWTVATKEWITLPDPS
ncbi:ABC transporter substrate-binding protein [Streptomyces sp. PSKA54]|uniref:ABC transporter substrate-binding protein n=1 Tax=Streptomyces himalayensis subsp. aureolus TaxID=2758039 RepID=A0A7W2D8P2_9ACTN|nr:ABC transporter substrate-binding protein [Streptomyces himalayensis]MBA4866602.1 ABC transporter substrate-binding protein [Streptomyces himalayensis subsp. aureolus]